MGNRIGGTLMNMNQLLERQQGTWITISPVPVVFKGHPRVPDGTPGLVVGICTANINVVVRADYPFFRNDVWAISIDFLEETQ
jgi:hypothetical protein